MTNRCFKCHPLSHRCLYRSFCLYLYLRLLRRGLDHRWVFSFLQKLTAVFGLLYSCVTGVKKSLCIWDRRMPLMTWRGRGREDIKMGHLFITLKICRRARVRCGQWEKVGPLFWLYWRVKGPSITCRIIICEWPLEMALRGVFCVCLICYHWLLINFINAIHKCTLFF